MMDVALLAQLRAVVSRLAAPAVEQIEYLRSINTYPSADELALEFHDLAVSPSRPRSHCAISDEALLSIAALNEKLTSFSGESRSREWDASALDSSPNWSKCERLPSGCSTRLDDAVPVAKGSLLAYRATRAAQAANEARLAAESVVFAQRTASELKTIYGWGNGLEDVQSARSALNAAAMARIQGALGKAEVEAARDLYRAAAATGRDVEVAAERAAYMEQGPIPGWSQ